jgi:hypothetical protein
VAKRMQIEVIRTPHPDAEREAATALDFLAEALADRLIDRARQEVARMRGVSEKDIDREHERVAEAARALSTMGVGSGDRAR